MDLEISELFGKLNAALASLVIHKLCDGRPVKVAAKRPRREAHHQNFSLQKTVRIEWFTRFGQLKAGLRGPNGGRLART